MARAFIVRPFGIKEGINFDAVEKDLVQPALAACDIQGSTTGPFLQAGNIREDMFQQLLVADVVVADISIHNANVFYELGIRHALQPSRTFLLRAKSLKDPKDRGPQDQVPFDLSTDRYLEYDSTAPKEKVEVLVEALKQTLASERPDSPVFRMLPDLQAQDRSRFLPLPKGFRDDVELAAKSGQLGMLGLLANETAGFFWASEGLRLVGRSLISLKAFAKAREVWEALYKLNPDDVEANQRLGTIYQRLTDIDASDQALQRVLALKTATPGDRAEALSLLARNIKDRWRSAWGKVPPEQAAAKALGSPELMRAYDKYLCGYHEDMDSYYPGLNALSLLTIAVELAKKLPDVWENRFETEEQAKAELDALSVQRQRLAGAVAHSLDAAGLRAQNSGKPDEWLEFSNADYQFLTSARPQKVAFTYRSAIEGQPTFNLDAARAQIEIFAKLGVLTDNSQAALAEFGDPATATKTVTKPERVILFTGHMIDQPGTVPPRFPDAMKELAQTALRDKLKQEMDRTKGNIVAIASGACGGDLLFHGVAKELGIDRRLLLPLPPDSFRNESVSPGGRYWEDLFDQLLTDIGTPACLSRSGQLPVWLTVRSGYTAWQRANLWLVYEALAVGANNFTLLALWDGKETTGIGGTYHMRTVAQQNGAALVTVYLSDLAKLQAAGAP
jgi:hypothetical protein